MFLLHLEMTVLIGKLLSWCVYDVEVAFSKYFILYLKHCLSFQGEELFPTIGLLRYLRYCAAQQDPASLPGLYLYSLSSFTPPPTPLYCVMYDSLYSHFLSGCGWGCRLGPPVWL